MLGKYSPTVSAAYRKDQGWHKWSMHTDGDHNDGLYDAEGYDSYGYNKELLDRAGHNEMEYMCDEALFEKVFSEWGVSEWPHHPMKYSDNGKWPRNTEAAIEDYKNRLNEENLEYKHFGPSEPHKFFPPTCE